MIFSSPKNFLSMSCLHLIEGWIAGMEWLMEGGERGVMVVCLLWILLVSSVDGSLGDVVDGLAWLVCSYGGLGLLCGRARDVGLRCTWMDGLGHA
ncbi:hypothetical protein DL95DRAFT_64297 [Leptodontidium sp. 2 PMI_412]|nr:hypothetical protein DL95DRAFT_64297 [Leptodontidium sp. 2 PMI_412]